jgi:hypothetical protein
MCCGMLSQSAQRNPVVAGAVQQIVDPYRICLPLLFQLIPLVLRIARRAVVVRPRLADIRAFNEFLQFGDLSLQLSELGLRRSQLLAVPWRIFLVEI